VVNCVTWKAHAIIFYIFFNLKNFLIFLIYLIFNIFILFFYLFFLFFIFIFYDLMSVRSARSTDVSELLEESFTSNVRPDCDPLNDKHHVGVKRTARRWVAKYQTSRAELLRWIRRLQHKVTRSTL
jgi:predicted membrane protein